MSRWCFHPEGSLASVVQDLEANDPALWRAPHLHRWWDVGAR